MKYAIDNLSKIAVFYKASTSQIQLDNKLSWLNGLTAGQILDIKCKNGEWSPVFATATARNSKGTGAGMTSAPSVIHCPAGRYAVAFQIQFSDLCVGSDCSVTPVAGIRMTCSGISTCNYLYNAQAGHETQLPPGSLYQQLGFGRISFNDAGGYITSIMGIGAQNAVDPENMVHTCPNGGVVTGFSAGAEPGYYTTLGYAYIQNLQFFCSRKYG